MTEQLSPGAMGIITRAVAGLFKSDPKAAKELIADASISGAIRKATDEAGKLLEMSTDSKLDVVEDQWDGSPDDKLEVKHVHGPGASAESGKVTAGPAQAASGDGAEKMTREYSRPAPQGGVQRATEQLGRDLGLSSMRKAMLLMHKALEGQLAQIDLLKAAVAAPTVDIEAVVSKAVETALAKAVTVAKAEEKKEEEKKEETAKGENPFEKEKEEDKEEAKSAAPGAAKAKSFLSRAKDAVRKSVDADLNGDAMAAKSWADIAKSRLEMATKFDASDDMAKAVVAVGKAIKGGEQNQDVWPATEEKKIGKSEAVVPAGIDAAKFAEGMEVLKKALDGQAMIQATVSDLFKVMGAQPRDPQNNLPPVFELVKSEAGVAAKEAEIVALVNGGHITRDDADHGRDILQKFQAAARGDLNRSVPEALAKRLPPMLRNLFIPAEQAA